MLKLLIKFVLKWPLPLKCVTSEARATEGPGRRHRLPLPIEGPNPPMGPLMPFGKYKGDTAFGLMVHGDDNFGKDKDPSCASYVAQKYTCEIMQSYACSHCAVTCMDICPIRCASSLRPMKPFLASCLA